MTRVWPALTLVALLVPTGTADASARDSVLAPSSRVWITGASNIRRFMCQAREISGALDLRGRPTLGSSMGGDNLADTPSLLIAVNAVDCGITAMSRHLRQTLRSDQFPAIEFRLATYDVDLSARTAVARLIGSVSIHGVRRPVEVTAAVRADSLGEVHVVGEYAVRMSDFGVRPPRRFGGLLRVKDRVTVHFDISPERTDAVDRLRCAVVVYPPVEPISGATHALCL